MDFALSEEQEQLRDSARVLLERECPTERVRRIMESESGHAPALWRSFAEAGWLGILVPEAFGGSGMTLLDAAVLLGELGRAVAPGPFVASQVAAVVALREAGSREQRTTWLPRLAAGEAIASFAIAEGPEPRFDGAGVAARAMRRGEAMRLDGRKLFVDHARLAELVIAVFRSGRPAARQPLAGLGLFCVPSGARGLSATGLLSVDETQRPCELRFRGVTLPRSAALGGDLAGPAARRAGRALSRVLDACAVAVAAESLGGAERALERAVEYVKVRQQFGRPVGSFQAVQHMAAEAVARIEPARALVWYAAWAFDARPREAPLAAAMAKAHLAEVYRAVARTAVEMHGGIGFTWENDMHLYLKRALANSFAWGDADTHRERVAELSGFEAPRKRAVAARSQGGAKPAVRQGRLRR